MAYSQIETRGQFVRLLGLGTSGRNLTRRWEKNPTDAGAQRPGVFSLRRMLYLVVWQMTAVLYISDLDEVDWNRRLVVPRDELKPPVSPFLKVTASPAGLIWEMWDRSRLQLSRSSSSTYISRPTDTKTQTQVDGTTSSPPMHCHLVVYPRPLAIWMS